MIYANVELTVEDRKTVANKNIVLYRGDTNVEIRFMIKGNRFVVLESTRAQMIIRRPSTTSIFSEIVPIENDTVIFTITAEMIDDLKEIGEYTFQIRLYDDELVARATLPPCEGCLIIDQPIAVEGEALVNVAMVNDSAVMAVASDTPEEEIFTEDNAYNRTVWLDGDIITDVRMNKIEDALYYINEKGGGGTATAPYISTSLPETVMVGTGEDFELDLDFSSPNLGKGTLKVFINDVDSMNQKIDQGMSITTIPGSLFSKGTNMVVIYILDRVGMMSNSLTFYVRYGGTEVTSTFDAYTSYDYGATVRYYFTPTALDTSLQLTFYMEIDGVTQAGVPCISDVRSYYTFPTNLSVGNHYCRAWVTDGTTRSNVLVFNLIILDATSLVVATDTLNPTVEEGTQLVLDYKVYMKNNTSFITKTYVDNNLVNTGTCTLETAYYRTTNLTAGTHTIKVEVFDVTETYSDFVTWTVTVTESTYTMLEPATAGSTFIATAYNKSNVDENREVWIGSNQDNDDITASLSNFSFNSENGWIDDALVISGNSWVEIPIQPLANNAQYGFTLDIEFKTKAIGVEDAEVLTLWNETDNCGIKITTEQLIIRSKSGNQADLYFGEDEVVSAIFVIDRDEKTAKIYLNGVMCEAFALSDYEAAGQKYLEDFTVNSNVFLGGYNKNGYCAIKNIRIYEVALATDEILNNYMSNEKDKLTQKKLVEFQKGDNLPTLTIYCDFAGLGKDDKKPCNIVYNSPDVNLYGESFTLDGKHSTLQYQGTSSMQYPIKNYRINPRNADGKVKLDPFNNGVGESRFTLKADFMSSGHWQNTGLAKWVNDKLYNYKTNDPSTMNARKWYDLQNGGSLKDTRETINGFPCRLILINDGETALNEGQQEPTPGNTKDMGIFNFNNDKDNVETLGFDTDIFPNCMSFEVTANSDTSAGAFVPYAPKVKRIDFLTDTTWDRTNIYMDYVPCEDLDLVHGQVISPNIVSKSNLIKQIKYTVVDVDMNILAIGLENILPDTAKYVSITLTLTTVNDETIEALRNRDISINGVDIQFENLLHNGLDLSKLPRIGFYDVPNAELEYLQNSFELRYPDSDDVGSDYGYLGIPSGELRVDYLKDGAAAEYVTTKISIDYLGGRLLTVGYKDGGKYKVILYDSDGGFLRNVSPYGYPSGTTIEIPGDAHYVAFGNFTNRSDTDAVLIINDIEYPYGNEIGNTNGAGAGDFIKNPYDKYFGDYGLKRVIDWVGNCTDEQFVAEFDQYFHRDYTLRYYLLVIVLGMVDNLGKNMMLDTFDGKIWLPRFYDMDTICSYDNSGEIKFDVDIEMEQGYWNTSSSRLWTKIRDLMHDELVVKYNDMRQNGMSFESFMSYFYDKQIAQIPHTYYNKDYDVKYAPYADEYMGKAHGNGYDHLKRWLKRRLIFTDTLFDYAPSYENDKITIRANTLDLMRLEIETYTPVYQHISFYNGNMEKAKIDGKTSTIFTGKAQTATDQEVLIYGGTNIKAIRGIPTMNPNSMLIGNASRLTELDLSNCPILSVVNSNKANFAPHTYLNKLNISNCPQLGGTLNVSNSPLLQNLNALGTTVDNILFPTSIRNLSTLRVPKTVNNLTLTDAGLLYTLEMEEGNNLQSISMTNCNNLTEMINFDLTQTPTVFLDNSFNGEEIYMSATTNLTLRNMPSLKRVIFTPNSEYSAFDINNVLNGANYKITTFNNPMMTDFITTAPHRLSYRNYELVDKEIFNYIEKTERFSLSDGYELELAGTNIGQLIPNNGSKYTDFINVKNAATYTVQTQDDNSLIFLRIAEYDKDYNFIKITQKTATITTDSQTAYLRVSERYPSYIQITGKFAKAEIIQVKDYGDITPNTAFTANTLDLADTQFQNVKFLCTTDVYNLKVPTTMKNFYCDSAMDIDTDVIEDASYEVIHEELIEPYTTDYKGEVKLVETGEFKNVVISDFTPGGYLHAVSGGVVADENCKYTDYYIEVVPGSYFECPNVRSFIQYDENYTISYASVGGRNLQGNTKYVRISVENSVESITVSYKGVLRRTPNIIPSSANGSLIFNMYSNNTTQPTSTSPYMWDLTGLKLEDFHTYGMNNWVKQDENGSITMPQRMPGYSVRLVNADITPDEYPTMLYPKWIDTGLPITGKLDYTKYNGTSLAWAYAYTTGDVNISPLDSRSIGQITNDYNKLYGTDFVDVVDVWVYKDTDTSKLSTNEAITKAYIELTSDNYKTRIDEVLAYYPNCTDLYFFDDGSVTNLKHMITTISQTNNQTYKGQIQKVIFVDGYFENLNSMERSFNTIPNLVEVDLNGIKGKINNFQYTFVQCPMLETVKMDKLDLNELGNVSAMFHSCSKFNGVVDFSNSPLSVFALTSTFQGCKVLTITPKLPSNISGGWMNNTFNDCTSLTTAPAIPDSVTSMACTFKGCSSLTTAPAIPNSVTNLNECFANCTSLTTPAVTPEGVTNMGLCYTDCTSLTTPPNIPSTCVNIEYICNRCGSQLKGNVVIPNNVENAYWAFRRTGINSISIPLDSLTNAGGIIDGCSDVDITWTGERSSDFIIPDMLGSCESTQADIQELVPEHLADRLMNKLTIVNHVYTINDTYTATNSHAMYNNILGDKNLYGDGTQRNAQCIMYKVIMDDVEILPILDEDGTPCFLNTNNGSKYYDTAGGTMTAGDIIGICQGYSLLSHIKANGCYVEATDITIDPDTHNLEYYFKPYQSITYSSGYVIANYVISKAINNTTKSALMKWSYNGGYDNNIVDTDGNEAYSIKLDDLTDAVTLTLGETYLSYLTEDEISKATDKGWTLQ